VGVGNRGRWPLEQCCPETGWQVVGLVDRASDHIQAAKKVTGLGMDACFNDLVPAMEKLQPEAVIFCTPTVTHAPWTKLAVERGIAVLCEKGMATGWQEAVDLVQFVRKKSGVFAVAQNYRYDGLYRLVAASLGRANGVSCPLVENPYVIDYVQHRVRPLPGTLTYPFASVWDMSCHHFDNLLGWLGPVDELQAHAYGPPWSPYQHPSNTSAFLRFANGVRVNYVHTHDASHNSLRIEVHGKNGCLRVMDRVAEFRVRPASNLVDSPVEPLKVPDESAEAAMLADFHAYVSAGVEPGISGYQNLETMALCEMTVRSAQESRPVRRRELL
jgi:predicted dehydrogenase